MMLSNAVRLSCLGISLACLAGGFASQARWLEAILVLLPVAALALGGKTAAGRTQPAGYNAKVSGPGRPELKDARHGLKVWTALRAEKTRRHFYNMPPMACLVALVFLAAIGLLVGAPASLMIPGAAAALAAWDLTNMGRLVEGRSLSATEQRIEKRHLLSLALALGLGLVLAGSGQLISLEIPFALLLVLAGLALFSLDRACRCLAEGQVRH